MEPELDLFSSGHHPQDADPQEARSDSVHSYDSEIMRQPLPEGIDGDLEFRSPSDLIEDDGYWTDTGSFDPHPSAPDADLELSSGDLKNLNSIVTDACLGCQPELGVKLPWETGTMKLIFDANDSDPSLPVLPVPVLSPVPVAESRGEVERAAKRHCPGQQIRGSFMEIIDFGLNVDEAELEDKKLSAALEKWYLIFRSGREAWPARCDLDDLIQDHRINDLRRFFGSRSSSTIYKRGVSVLKFMQWYRTQYFSVCPFPMEAEVVTEYLQHLTDKGTPASTMSGFLESLNFCFHVLDIRVIAGNVGSSLNIPKQSKNLVEIRDMARQEKGQARVLTVAEVSCLEEILSDETELLEDRVAAGCFLFCLHSRSRWSDIKKVSRFTPDFSEVEGKLTGYIEFSTRSHKTARLVARQGIAMPLIAPIWGIGKTPWGILFPKVFNLSGRRIEDLHQEPLLCAPSFDGGWMGRSVTTKEAGAWLRSLIFRKLNMCDHTTVHTLKATPLSWCAKAGLPPDSRLLLGHHASGHHSADTYARDVLAHPLRQYEEVLQRIRMGAFRPDASRSGMLLESSKPDPKESYTVPEEVAPEDHPQGPISEDSSSSSSSESDSVRELVAEEQETLHGDPIAEPTVWEPDVTMYQHKRSSIIHIMAAGTTNGKFSCGNKLTRDYVVVRQVPFLELRKCKRCEVARPIKDVGALASALHKINNPPRSD